MAWIDEKPSGTCLVRWREPGGKTVSASRPDRAAAELLKLEVEAEILRGTYVPQSSRRMPFLQYATAVLEADAELAPRTLENHLRCLKLQLGSIAELPLEDLDAHRVRRLFADQKKAGATDHVLGQMKKTVSKVCSAAVEEGVLTRNPARAAKVKQPPRRKVKPLTPEQVETTASTVPPRWRAAVLLGAWGGLRISEVGALTRADVDWERNGVQVPKVKTKARFVTLPSFVMNELRRHMLEFAGEETLFPTAKGNPVNHWAIAPIMRKTGVRFHDLRHTAVAILIKLGKHPRAIMERMGHSSITQTMDTYGHLFEGAHDELAQELEQFDPGEMGKVIEL